MKKIRKISIGTNPKDCLAYVVGSLHNNGELRITDIIQEQTSTLFKRATKYYIWAERTHNDKGPFLWYEINNMPVMIQYDINNETNN